MLCFYYSQATDWNEPNGGMNNWDFKEDKEKDSDQYLRDKSMPQVAELLKNYGPIGLIWFDVPVLVTPERSKKLANLVRSIQPDVLINSRLRYFTDGAVIGSKVFVNEGFEAARDRFTTKRKDDARRLRGSGKAAAGVLWSVRDLRVGIG